MAIEPASLSALFMSTRNFVLGTIKKYFNKLSISSVRPLVVRSFCPYFCISLHLTGSPPPLTSPHLVLSVIRSFCSRLISPVTTPHLRTSVHLTSAPHLTSPHLTTPHLTSPLMQRQPQEEFQEVLLC